MSFSSFRFRLVFDEDQLSRWVIPLGLFLLNVILKSLYLNGRSISGDEPFSIYHAQMSVTTIFIELSKGNNPPLFEIMLHYWIHFFGISAVSTRMLPMLFSAATASMLYQLVRRFFTLELAIAASLLFTCSNFQLYYAQETRVYSFFALMTTVSMYAFMSLAEASRSKMAYLFSIVVLCLSNLILVYAHFFGWFVPATQLLCCFVYVELRHAHKILIRSALFLGLCYLPYLRILMTRFMETAKYGTWLTPVYRKEIVEMLNSFLNTKLVTMIFGACIIVAMIKLVIHRFREIGIHHKILATWFVFPFGVMFLVSWNHFPYPVPMFFGRYLIFLSIALYPLVVLAIQYLLAGWRYAKYVLYLPVLLMATSFVPYKAKDKDMEQSIEEVKTLKTAKTLLYFSPDWFDLNIAYYYNKDFFSDIDEKNVMRKLSQNLARDGVYGINGKSQIDTLKMKSADRLIFFDNGSDFVFPNNKIREFLNGRFDERIEYHYNGIGVYVYSHKPPKP